MTREGNSTLIRLPPKVGDHGSAEHGALSRVVAASTPEELARQARLDPRVLDRALLRGQTLDNYRILGFVAAGGMGEIYAAERLDDEGARRSAVALKVVVPERGEEAQVLARLQHEARLCSMVQSDHVVAVYEYGVDERQRAFVAMELLQGEELFDRMRHHKVFPLRTLAELAMQVLAGLEATHAVGVVHRDIKPENIFLASAPQGQERAKLIDFGIARCVYEQEPAILHSPGQIYGTPQYLSPEQSTRPDAVDHRADLYSLGVVLYECATGSPPFDKGSPYAIMLAHQQDPVPALPSSLDPEFCEIILKALAKKPQDRWQSAREMAQVVGRWIEETSWVDELPGMGAGFDPGPDSGGLSFEDLALPSAYDSHQSLARRSLTPRPRPRQLSTPLGVPMAGVLRKQRASGEHPQLATQQVSTADFGAVPASTRALSAATRPRAASDDSDLTLDIPTARKQSRGVLMSSPLELTPTVQEQRPVSAPAQQAEASPAQREGAPTEADSRKATLITALVIALVIAAAALSMFGPWRVAPEAPPAASGEALTGP